MISTESDGLTSSDTGELDTGACRICGGISTGLHYGVVTCEGCKVFFKRYMSKRDEYRCYFGGSCQINLQTRSRCRACRLKKCVDQGMSVEAIRLGRAPKLRPKVHHIGSGNFGTLVTPRNKFRLTSVIRRTPASTAVNSVESCPDSPSPNPPDPISPPSDEPIELDSISDSLANLDKRLHRLYISCAKSPHELLRISHPYSDCSFADANLTFMVTDFLGDFIRPCRLPKDRSLDSRMSCEWDCSLPETEQKSSMLRYWNVMQSRCRVLEESIKWVSDAMMLAFGEEITATLEGVEKWYTRGLVEYQPVCTLRQMLVYAENTVMNHAQMLVRFTNFVPGFTDLCANDRCVLVRDRWYTTFMMVVAFAYIDRECYYAYGPYRMQFSCYWMEQIVSSDFRSFIFATAEQITALKLNLVETALLLAVGVFRIDAADNIEDRVLVDFLYGHYMDALIHLVGHRSREFFEQLHAMIRQFSVMNEVHRRLILSANIEQSATRRIGDKTDITTTVLLHTG